MTRSRRLLTALLVEPQHHKAVEAGESVALIKDGHRNYNEGIVILAWYLTSWCRLGIIRRVVHTSVDFLTDDECIKCGFVNTESAVEHLRKKYPGLNFSSDITIVEFREL